MNFSSLTGRKIHCSQPCLSVWYCSTSVLLDGYFSDLSYVPHLHVLTSSLLNTLEAATASLLGSLSVMLSPVILSSEL